MSEMRLKKLGEVATVVSGSTPKTSVDEYWNGNYCWVTPAELSENTVTINNTERKITKKAIKDTNLKLLPVGTVLLSSRAPIGKVAIVGAEMYCNQGFKSLICSDEIHNMYLFWFLKAKTAFLNSMGRGATFKEISKSIVEQIEIPLPPLETQKEIAKTLDIVVELLAIRKRQLAELDNLIKSAFYDMFGDLHINEKEWNCASIVDVCDEIVDCVNKTAPTISEKSPYKMLRTTNIKNGYVDTQNVKYVDKETFYKWTKRSTPKRGDVLLTREAPIGEVGIIQSDENLFLGQRIISYRVDASKMNQLFLLHLMKSEYFQHQIVRLARGSTVKHLSVPECNLFQVLVPPVRLQNQFAARVTKIEEQKALVQKAIDETQYLFASLMNEYFE